MRVPFRLVLRSIFTMCLAVAVWTTATGVASSQTDKPLRLPYDTPAGPSTWLFGQPYGNTVMAYRSRNTMYQAGQGIHFGLDFASPCGTPIVAMADGFISAVDEPRYGSLPHNLMIDHPDLGYATFYGHLLEKPDLLVGQAVKAGEVVALSGDSEGTSCTGRPHLHVEVRDINHWKKYNPIQLIDVNWNALALIGPFDNRFERNLDDPNQWQQLDDQPEIVVGGEILNDFANPWPPSWDDSPSGSASAGGQNSSVAVADGPESVAPRVHTGVTQTTSRVLESSATTGTEVPLRQVTKNGCCTQPFWDPSSSQVLFIGRDVTSEKTGILAVDGLAVSPQPPTLFTDDLTLFDSQFEYRVVSEASATVLQKLVDRSPDQGPKQFLVAQRWILPAQASSVSVSPSGSRVAWQITDQSVPFERRAAQIWVMNLNSGQQQAVVDIVRGGIVGWSSEDSLVISERPSRNSRQQFLYTLRLSDEQWTLLAVSENLRGTKLSPTGEWVAYYVSFNEDTTENGIWIARTDGTARYLIPSSLFGMFDWRDAEHLLLVPMRPDDAYNQIWQVNMRTLTATLLVGPDQAKFEIANADWAISPNGSQVAFVNAADRNIWTLALPD